MASRLRRAWDFIAGPETSEERNYSPVSWNDWLGYFKYGGVWNAYGGGYTLNARQEEPDASFVGYVSGLYRANPVVFACMQARALLFSEARFQFRQIKGGRPGDLFGTPELAVLEEPWPNGTTRDLLLRAIQDVDISGNFYAVREGDRLYRLRPDWVSIILGSQRDPDDPGLAYDSEVLGYLYKPGGRAEDEPTLFLTEQVCHFAPIPDPLANFRGMSWLTPVIRDVMGDQAAAEHKLKFFENGATVNLAIGFPPDISKDLFDKYVEAIKAGHEGASNAYRTLFLGGGAQPIPIGANLEQVDFKVVQGAGETRIAAAAGVPPVIVGLSEGLAAATYSNYAQSIRRFTDLTMRPLWGKMADSLASIVTEPSQASLWYDDRDIPALAEDQKDLAEIKQSQASQIKTLIDAGFEADSVVAAVTSSDFSRLTHSGLFSVQLQPPKPDQPEEMPSENGTPPVPIGAA